MEERARQKSIARANVVRAEQNLADHLRRPPEDAKIDQARHRLEQARHELSMFLTPSPPLQLVRGPARVPDRTSPLTPRRRAAHEERLRELGVQVFDNRTADSRARALDAAQNNQGMISRRLRKRAKKKTRPKR